MQFCLSTFAIFLFSTINQVESCGPTGTGPTTSTNKGDGKSGNNNSGNDKVSPDPALSAQCSAIACDFANGGGPCKYTLNSGTPQWANQNKPLGNRDTGIPSPDRGKPSYYAVHLKPGQSATMTSPDVSFSSQKSLLVRYYEATDGIVLSACSNDLNSCQDISSLNANRGDRNWRDGAASITTATKKILIVAKNVGGNIGAVGISNIGIGDSQPGSRNRCP